MADSTTERGLTVTINDRTVRTEPNETILQAALRSGVDFPHSCGVGGCGTCKCRVRRGEVKELTETGYLLTSEEIEQHYVLACQAVARTDAHVEVDLGGRTRGAR